MANATQLEILKRGKEAWNEWRMRDVTVYADLSDADLSNLDLTGHELFCTDFTGAILTGAALSPNLSRCNFANVDLREAKLWAPKFYGANLTGANLTRQGFHRASFQGADLTGADLTEASFADVSFEGATLTKANLTRIRIGKYGLVLPKALAGARFIEVNLNGLDFQNANLAEADFSGARLIEANFTKADLTNVTLSGALLVKADFSNSTLVRANFSGTRYGIESAEGGYRDKTLRGPDGFYRIHYVPGATLTEANFTGAILCEANFTGANINKADFAEADLTNSILKYASLVEANIKDAILNGCFIYGLAAWGLKGVPRQQKGLIITSDQGPEITVDDIQTAQFIYLLLNNENIRNAIDTITSKVVLILGRFTAERKFILDALRDELRNKNYLPVLFDFEGPATRDITETVSTLAHLARFVIADITDAKSIPQELMAIVPNLPSVPVQPLLLASQREYGMYEHFKRYSWVLDTYHYQDVEDVLQSLSDKIIRPAEEWINKQK